MGNDSYLGGSTKVWLSKKGTAWAADWESGLKVAGEFFDRWDKRDKIAFSNEVRVLKKQRKQFTYFMRACAMAFKEETLSEAFPPAPSFLAKRVRGAGGTASWLASDRRLLELLTRMINAQAASAAREHDGG